MNTALLAAASGDWTRAEEALGEMVAKDPGNFTVGRATGVERREVNRFPRTFGRRSTTSLSRYCVREESKRYGDATDTSVSGELTVVRMGQGIDLLEAALKTSPSSAVVAEPFLFNLCTRLLFFR